VKLIARQKIWLAIVVAANALLWLIPSDVVEQIARDRHTMLGRYSRTQFSWMVAVAILSLVSLYVDWSTGKTYRRRWFQVLAAALFLIPGLAVVDFLLRTPEGTHYVRASLAYHRPANAEYSRLFTDRPQAYRTYPDAPSGYGTVMCKLRTDGRGFRNPANYDRCDVVVLGDSFAEGSNVSDEQVWAVHLATKSGLSVCNLAVSGYDPLHYLASLEEYGLALKPRHVLCMLYEGNDFRSARSDSKRKGDSLSERLDRYVKQSPVINALDNLLIRTFGPINSDGPVTGIETLDWLPLAVPEGPDAKYYAFAPTQLRDLYVSREAFARDRHWLNPRGQIAEMHKLCADAGAELVVVYAPLKAHVVLPIVADHLPDDKVRKFTAISYKQDLPKPDAFLATLLERLDARESVVAEWCQSESIPFITLTPALREGVLNGRQVYYTYDQHWTPDGHEVVANAVLPYLKGAVLPHLFADSGLDGMMDEPEGTRTSEE
jgi:hypothetical protein